MVEGIESMSTGNPQFSAVSNNLWRGFDSRGL
jgi:hypothetical protein